MKVCYISCMCEEINNYKNVEIFKRENYDWYNHVFL